jgi:hypothetical protein
MSRSLFALLLCSACSFVAIHYPDTPHNPSTCERWKAAPVFDTASAAAVLGMSARIYNDQTRTSPWPISGVVIGAWAIASATYGFFEVKRCRCSARQLDASPLLPEMRPSVGSAASGSGANGFAPLPR